MTEKTEKWLKDIEQEKEMETLVNKLVAKNYYADAMLDNMMVLTLKLKQRKDLFKVSRELKSNH